MKAQFRTELTESIRDKDCNNFCDHVRESLDTWLSGEIDESKSINELTNEFMDWYMENTPEIHTTVLELEDAWSQSRSEWGEWIEDADDNTEIYLTICPGTFQFNWEAWDGKKSFSSINPLGNFNDFMDYLSERNLVRL